ncbi:MFS transporter [Phormidium tenue FACHB-886]|nr:MFS transporter [Phormidium tenue FACHB-886]
MQQLEVDQAARGIVAIGISAFAVVTTEFIIVGLLPLIAADLAIPISTTGLLVSIYAFTVVPSAPILTALTSKLCRRNLLIGVLSLQIITNLLAAIAPNYTVLLIARIISAFSLAVFWSIAAIVAISLVPEHRRGWAISVVFAGISAANLFGIPLGTVIGQSFGWRAAFAALTGLGLLALVAIALFLPTPPKVLPPSLQTQLRLLRQPQFLMSLAVSVAIATGDFLAFTYLVPFLQQVTRLSGSGSSLMLLLFGIAGIVGNFAGGRAADRGVVQALLLTMGALAVSFVGLSAIGTAPGAVVALILLWGMAHAALFVEIQYRMIMLAPDATDTASALNVSIINTGIGLGAALGSLVVENSGVRSVGWAGGLLALVAIGLLLLSCRGTQPESTGKPRSL